VSESDQWAEGLNDLSDLDQSLQNSLRFSSMRSSPLSAKPPKTFQVDVVVVLGGFLTYCDVTKYFHLFIV